MEGSGRYESLDVSSTEEDFYHSNPLGNCDVPYVDQRVFRIPLSPSLFLSIEQYTISFLFKE